MYDRPFLENFWLLLADDCLIEMIFEVRQTIEFPLVSLGVDIVDPGLNFKFDLIFDEVSIIEAALMYCCMFCVKYNGRDIFYQYRKIVLTYIIILKEVVQPVGVELVPDQINY